MFTKPEGPHLTPEQARELDDTFFGSRPFEYFCARIASLISSADSPAVERPEGLGADFFALLGLVEMPHTLPFSDSDRELQVATDSFAVRHHAAEALVRLYHALTVAKVAEGSPGCVWESIADGPIRTVDLVGQSRSHLSSNAGRDSFWTLVLPPHVAAESGASEEITTTLNVLGAWLGRAMNLLTRDDININAAHNKVKHGLAVRSHGDIRMTFTTQAPNADGTIPLSALTGPNATDIFNTVTLDYLARPPGKKSGLEVSTLGLAPAKLLAESWMMAVTYAAMFHIAATQHFANRDLNCPTCPTYPRLPLGPTPEQLLDNSVVGLRHPVTLPLDGKKAPREAGIAFEQGFVTLDIDFDNNSVATVVDD